MLPEIRRLFEIFLYLFLFFFLLLYSSLVLGILVLGSFYRICPLTNPLPFSFECALA